MHKELFNGVGSFPTESRVIEQDSTERLKTSNVETCRHASHKAQLLAVVRCGLHFC